MILGNSAQEPALCVGDFPKSLLEHSWYLHQQQAFLQRSHISYYISLCGN